MTAKELFRAKASNQFKSVMDSDEMVMAEATVIAIISENLSVGKREMRGARLAFSALLALHLKDEEPKRTPVPALDHRFDERGKAKNEPSKKT